MSKLPHSDALEVFERQSAVLIAWLLCVAMLALVFVE